MKIYTFEETAIYVHNIFKISKLNWFGKTESLALRITDSNNEFFDKVRM